MPTQTTPDTLGVVVEATETSTPNPQVAVELMLAEIEITRAQLGLGPSVPPEQPMLRDLSPFGR